MDVVLRPCLIEWVKECPLTSSVVVKGRRLFYRGQKLCRVSGLLRIGWALRNSLNLQAHTSYNAAALSIASE